MSRYSEQHADELACEGDYIALCTDKGACDARLHEGMQSYLDTLERHRSLPVYSDDQLPF